VSGASAAYAFAGWIGLLICVWFLFEKSESVASEETKRLITRWLRNIDPISPVSKWQATFVQVFDRLFGQRHFTCRCFARSSVASFASVGIVTLLWGALRPDEVHAIPYGGGRLTLAAVLIGTAVLNLIPDFVSLVKTRYLIGWMMPKPTLARSCVGLVCDLIATVLLATMSLWSLLLVRYSKLVWQGVWTLGVALRTTFVLVVILMVTAVPLTNGGGSGIPNGIWLYSMFSPSIWVWLYALSGLIVRLAQGLGIGVTTVQGLLDIDRKPITSLGWVAMLLTSIVYWVMAVVVWLNATDPDGL